MKSSRVLLISMVTNTFLSFLKILGGMIGNSQSLLVNGFYSLSDLITDLIAFVGDVLVRRPASQKYPLGYGKLEYFISFLIGGAILFLGIECFLHSFETDIFRPGKIVLFILIVSLFAKLIVCSFLYRVGKKENNPILLSSFRESFLDVISSLVLFFLLTITYLFPNLTFLDQLGSLLMSGTILLVGVFMMIENVQLLLDKAVSIDEIAGLKLFLLQSYYDISKTWLIPYGTYYHLIIQIEEGSFSELQKQKEKILSSFSRIKYVTIRI